jgi:hypothetical protein
MAYVVNNNNNQPDQEVAGANPLSQGQAPAAQPQQQAQVSPSQTPATVQTGASADQANQQVKKPSQKGSSGMFTNVQKYVDRNRPQAQKMAKAVTQDFSKQASDIAKQVQQQSNEQSGLVAGNVGQIQGQYGEAQDIIGDIMGPGYEFEGTPEYYQTPQQQPPATQDPLRPDTGATRTPGTVDRPDTEGTTAATPPTQEELDYFKNLMKGPIGINEVPGLNLAQESNRAQALANLAQGAGRGNFRRGLMRDTFGGAGRQYTRGQSALDELIMTGSKQATQGLIQDTQKQAEGLVGEIRDAQRGSAADMAMQSEMMRSFGGDVRALAEQARDPMYNQAKSAFDEAMVERALLTGDMSGLTEDQKSLMGEREFSGKTISEIEKISRELNKLYDLQNTQIDLNAIKGIRTGNVGGFYDRLKGTNYAQQEQAIMDLIGKGVDEAVLRDLGVYDDYERLNALQNMGSGQEYRDNYERIYGEPYVGDWDTGYKGGTGWDTITESSRKMIEDKITRSNRILEALTKNRYNTLRDEFDAAGFDYDQFLANQDMSMADFAGDNRDKINTLGDLLGLDSQQIAEDEIEGYLSKDALQAILDKYKLG